jgi:hypothetical protein
VSTPAVKTPTTSTPQASSQGGGNTTADQLPMTGLNTMQAVSWAMALITTGLALLVAGLRRPRRVRA